MTPRAWFEFEGRMEPVTTAARETPTPTPTPAATPRATQPVLGRLLSGSFWLAVRTPIQTVLSLATFPLQLQAVGALGAGAYGFAYGFGFLQSLLELGMGSALQRHVSETWAKGDRKAVDRAIACGLNFYAVMALVQAVVLLAIAYLVLPRLPFQGASYRLIVKLLWLQAVTAPCYGISMVVSSVLQATRRYDFMPRLELVVVVLRFLVLWAGVRARVDFFAIVVTQTLLQIGLTLLPATWVVVRELGYLPTFRGTRLVDYKPLIYVSTYMFLMQLSVVLADKVDTTVLGFAVRHDPEQAIAVYQAVSKPFVQIRQTGWTLAYLVLPAVASLAAARDRRGLERVTYDGTRLHLGAILPISLLAWVYAAPFLTLWVGNELGYDAAREAPLLRLFLVATLPLILSVPVQAALGLNKVEVVALAALAGSLVNLPVSVFLTSRYGVSGVIWGTVLTTLFSNLLVPGVYVFRVLEIRPRTFLTRTLAPPLAGAFALLVVTGILRTVAPLHPSPVGGLTPIRVLPMVAHLTAGCLAYAAGYLAVPVGRGDLRELAAKVARRPA